KRESVRCRRPSVRLGEGGGPCCRPSCRGRSFRRSSRRDGIMRARVQRPRATEGARAAMTTSEAERARRVERVEVLCAYEWAEAYARAVPTSGSAAWEVGKGAVAAWMGKDSPMSRVIGLGMEGDVADADLDALERAFRERGTPLRVELCPIAGGPLGRRLSRRGYGVTGFEDMLVREVTTSDAELAARADAGLTPEV